MPVHRCSISWFYYEGEYALFLLPSIDRSGPRNATAVGALIYFDAIGKLQRQIDWKYDATKHSPLHEFLSTVTSIDSWLSFYIGLEDDAKGMERRWMCEPLTRPRIGIDALSIFLKEEILTGGLPVNDLNRDELPIGLGLRQLVDSIQPPAVSRTRA